MEGGRISTNLSEGLTHTRANERRKLKRVETPFQYLETTRRLWGLWPLDPFCCAKVDAEQQITKAAVPGQIIFWAVSWRNLAALAFIAH